MLVDPVSLDLAPIARELLDGDESLKLELPAVAGSRSSTAPAARVADAIAELAAGRRRLAAARGGAGARDRRRRAPVRRAAGELNAGERYDAILADYGDAARVQLVCALQVHVAIGYADATLAVYNALRGHLPELAALAANAPFHAGRDTGFASVRPLIGDDAPAPGRPAADPLVGGVRGDAALDGRPEELVVRAASASVLRHARAARLRHPDDRARGRRGRRLRPRARRLVGRARRRPMLPRSPGGSPRTAGAPRATGSTRQLRRPRHRRAAAGARRPARAARAARPGRGAARLRRRTRAAGADRAQRRHAPARGRRSTALTAWLADHFLES